MSGNNVIIENLSIKGFKSLKFSTIHMSKRIDAQ